MIKSFNILIMNETEQLSHLKNITDNFYENIKQVTQLALECPKGGDEKWFQLLTEYNITPSTQQQKDAFYTQGMPVIKGALPTELRKVYQSIRLKAILRFTDQFANSGLDFDAEMFWQDFIVKLDQYIEEEISTYIGKIKQTVNVSNIFANAFSGMNKYSHGLKESGLNTKQCNSCGSPRLDTNQYGECYFCGTPLFESARIVAKCKICGSPKYIENQEIECQFCGN
jgi:hypothetical protein